MSCFFFDSRAILRFIPSRRRRELKFPLSREYQFVTPIVSKMAKSKPQLTLKELRKAVDSDGAIDLSLKELKEKDVPVKDLVRALELQPCVR